MMVWDKSTPLLTEHDWRILGHEMYQNDKLVLPVRRIDVPFPYQPDGLHVLAHRFAGLSEECHKIAREATMGISARLAIGDAMNQVMQIDRFCKGLRRDWEREYRELSGGGAEIGGNVRTIPQNR